MKSAILLAAAAAMTFATSVAAHEEPACDRARPISQADRYLAASGFIGAYKTPTGWEE